MIWRICLATLTLVVFISVILLLKTPLSAGNNTKKDKIPEYTYRIERVFPHDPSAYTQGLIYSKGIFYEGTGLRGQSSLRKVDAGNGLVLQIHELPDSYFGEGVTVYDGKIIQLTWQSKIGFVYDESSFIKLEDFYYDHEGWGITHDGQRLIMSDGTATLYYLDPHTFQITGKFEVVGDDGPVSQLNELEYIDGEIFANVWPTDRIARISPKTGKVTGWIDLSGLLGNDRTNETDALNGIAWDAENKRLFVTGKLWPKLYQISLELKK